MTKKSSRPAWESGAWLVAGLILATAARPGTALAQQNPFPPAAPAAPQNPFPPAAAPAAPQNPFPPATAPSPQPSQPTPPPVPPQAGAAATPPGAAQPTSLQQFFVGGHWRSVVPGPQGTEITDFQFRPDGSFAELDRYIPRGGQPINVVFTGHWAVQPLQGATVQMQLQPQHAYPPQICGANGACQTVPLRPATYQLTLMGRNAIQFDGHIIKRVP